MNISKLNLNNTSYLSFKQADSGSKNKHMLAFDLDGTFAKGTPQDYQKFQELRSGNDCRLAYATGNSRQSYNKLNQKLEEKGITLPTPDYLVTCNGQFIYRNEHGSMVMDHGWVQRQQQTGFDKEVGRNAVSKVLGAEPPVILTEPEVKFVGAKEGDEVFQIDFHPSPLNVEYFVPKDRIEPLKAGISRELGKSGVQATFISDYVPKQILQRQPEESQRRLAPIADEQGGLWTINVLAADKADAVKYLAEKEQVKTENVITAGNAPNDEPLVRQGWPFIMVGDADPNLRSTVESLTVNGRNNLFSAIKPGAAGVNEGLEKFLTI